MSLAGFNGEKKATLLGDSRIVNRYRLIESLLANRCRGRMLTLFELFLDSTQMKARKLGQMAIPYLFYNISRPILGPHR